MKEEGTVREINDSTVRVEIVPREACTKCCSCKASGLRDVFVENHDMGSLTVGDRVEIEIESPKMMRVYMLLYAVPLIIFLAGLFCAYILFASPVISVLTAFVATIIAYIVIGSRIRKMRDLAPQIITKINVD